MEDFKKESIDGVSITYKETPVDEYCKILCNKGNIYMARVVKYLSKRRGSKFIRSIRKISSYDILSAKKAIEKFNGKNPFDLIINSRFSVLSVAETVDGKMNDVIDYASDGYAIDEYIGFMRISPESLKDYESVQFFLYKGNFNLIKDYYTFMLTTK